MARHLRLNVTLPEETVRLIARVVPKGGRSRLIDEAVRRFIGGKARGGLRARLKEGALAGAESDLRLAEEWFLLEEEAWAGRRR